MRLRLPLTRVGSTRSYHPRAVERLSCSTVRRSAGASAASVHILRHARLSVARLAPARPACTFFDTATLSRARSTGRVAGSSMRLPLARVGSARSCSPAPIMPDSPSLYHARRAYHARLSVALSWIDYHARLSVARLAPARSACTFFDARHAVTRAQRGARGRLVDETSTDTCGLSAQLFPRACHTRLSVALSCLTRLPCPTVRRSTID